MTHVAARDLRNHTAEVLRQVAEGSVVTVTVHGRPVAEIRPASGHRATTLTRTELARLLSHEQADAGMRGDLAALGDAESDETGPLR